jgi:hypothetical protein
MIRLDANEANAFECSTLDRGRTTERGVERVTEWWLAFKDGEGWVGCKRQAS